jgi:hypothetical protein
MRQYDRALESMGLPSRLEASRWRTSAISFKRRLSCKVRRASRCLSGVRHNREIIEISTA